MWSSCLLFFDKLVGYMQFLVRGSLIKMSFLFFCSLSDLRYSGVLGTLG